MDDVVKIHARRAAARLQGVPRALAEAVVAVDVRHEVGSVGADALKQRDSGEPLRPG